MVMGYPQFATRLCVSFIFIFKHKKPVVQNPKHNYSHINSFCRSEISLINPMMEFLQVTSTSLQQVSLLFLFLRELIKYCNGSIFCHLMSWLVLLLLHYPSQNYLLFYDFSYHLLYLLRLFLSTPERQL